MFSVLFVGFIQSFSFPACLLRKLQESFNFISEREIVRERDERIEVNRVRVRLYLRAKMFNFEIF